MSASLAGARVLVLGGTGFIGRRLLERWILEEGVEATVLVRTWSRAAAVARYPARLLGGDVLEGAALDEALRGQDLVVDLTWASRGALAERRRHGAAAGRRVVEAAHAAGVRRLVHVSSVAVLGTPPDGVLDDASPVQRSKDPYAEGKRTAESEVLARAQATGLSTAILRPTIVHGPGAGWSAGTLGWLQAARIALADGGAGACNAVYVDDVVDAIRAAAVAPKAPERPLLVSGAEAVTWAAWYDAHARVAGVDEPYDALPADEIRQRLRSRRREQRPLRRFVRRVRQDGGLRQDLMSLPGPAQVFGVARWALPERGWRSLKGHLLRRTDADPGPAAPVAVAPARRLELPAVGLLRLHASRARVAIEGAREAIGYEPAFDLQRALVRTAAWARWARLIPAGQGGG